VRTLITGGSGLVGTALTQALLARGDTVVSLGRPGSRAAGPSWDPAQGHLNPENLAGFDAVVHLAGENVASGRWTPEKKRRIRESRVEGTRLLVDGLIRSDPRPRTLVAASAIGYYGDRQDAWLRETDEAGDDFLAEVTKAWESESKPALAAGIRVVWLRIGIVLSPSGGALDRMLPFFRLGLGGPIGSGKQYMSWITLSDLVRMALFALDNDTIQGPYNAVAPHPVDNKTFSSTLGRVLGRPAVLPIPRFALRVAFGELSDLLFGSCRVSCERIVEGGFSFEHDQLEPALRSIL
jgi:uncharacterized protein